jgi:hypothetical protein
MKLIERLRNRSLPGEAGSPEASPPDEQRLPIARYDQLNRKQLIAQLSHLSQLELAAVEAHERSHQGRPVVLNRLRWLRGSEPLPDYDVLDSDEIIRALAASDATTVKAVRSYERRHRNRREVLSQATRVLPTARASIQQNRARKDRAALVEAGIRPDPSTAREEQDEREQLREEARYRRERLDLYRARLYGGRAASQPKLQELQRASDGAAARLRRAEASATTTLSAAGPAQ